MSTIMTNNAAVAALNTLRNITKGLDSTQERVSSGLRIQTASDDAAYWSIGTTMKSDNHAVSAVRDALNLGGAKVDTAYQGLESILDVMSGINAKLVAAREPGVDKDKIGRELSQLQNQIRSIAQSSSFAGENWLLNTNIASWTTPEMKEMVASFVRQGNGVSIQTIDLDLRVTSMISDVNPDRGILTSSQGAHTFNLIETSATTASTRFQLTSATSDTQIVAMIDYMTVVTNEVTDAATTLGSLRKRLDLQTTFANEFMSITDRGVGRLIDAEMGEESTRLKALQSQQQLGVQALSIANASADSLLQLLR